MWITLQNATMQQFPIALRLNNGTTQLIRLAEESDASSVVDYLNKVGGESDYLYFGANEFDGSVDDERKLISTVRESNNSIFLIAEVEGEIVGMLTFSGGSRPRNRHRGELGMSVVKRCWGMGIGRGLMQTLIDWAEGNPVVHKLNPRVRLDNEPAIKLYTRLGFRQEGVVTRDLLVGETLYDCLLMGRAV